MRKPKECTWLAAVLLAICTCFSNGYKTYAEEIQASAGGVDVMIHGERLYGIYSEYKGITGSTTNLYRSAIVLMPWNNRPKISVSVQPTTDGMTIVTMNGEKFEFKGRSALDKATLDIISRAAP